MSNGSEFDEYRFRYESEINQAIAFGGKSHDFYTSVKAQTLVQLARRLQSPRPLDVLDVGCGNGSLHPFLLASDLSLKITGVEVAAEFVNMARDANKSVQYDVYDGNRLPYDATQFDVAVTICVMHHVPPAQWPAFLAEMYRVVRPGGLVAIFEHNPFNPLTSYIVKTCPLDQNAVLLRPSRLTQMMKAAGMEDVSCRYILFTPLAGAAFRRMDDFLHWLPLGAQYVAFGRIPEGRIIDIISQSDFDDNR